MVRLLVAGILVLIGCVSEAQAAETVGWVERVRIYPGALEVEAKVDSGADNSSLHCNCIEPYTKPDGSKWVRFTVTNYDGKQIRLDQRVVRTARIKRHGEDDQRRLVIRLGICLGHTYRETDVNLVDRGGFEYQMLIGRSFLRGKFLINPARRYLNAPRCDVPAQ